MGNEMIIYFQQLELLAFFSGYPLVYAIMATIKNTARSETSLKKVMFKLLPGAYALSGILYLSLQVRNFYPNYSFDHISSELLIPFYVVWGLTSTLFFIPLLYKKPIISLLHSLVFFYLAVRNYYLEITADTTDKTVLKNYMKIYLDSILLNVGILVVLLILCTSAKYLRKKRKLPGNSYSAF